MAILKVSLRSTAKAAKKIFVEVDAVSFERLAADFGLFNPAFTRSLARAEQDYRAGRVQGVRSLKQLRTKRYA